MYTPRNSSKIQHGNDGNDGFSNRKSPFPTVHFQVFIHFPTCWGRHWTQDGLRGEWQGSEAAPESEGARENCRKNRSFFADKSQRSQALQPWLKHFLVLYDIICYVLLCIYYSFYSMYSFRLGKRWARMFWKWGDAWVHEILFFC